MTNHGGKRKNSGRKTGVTKTPISIKLDNELLEKIRLKGDGITQTIEAALKEYLK
jgi:uncharacterized protein (DUF4415 family)